MSTALQRGWFKIWYNIRTEKPKKEIMDDYYIVLLRFLHNNKYILKLKPSRENATQLNS